MIRMKQVPSPLIYLPIAIVYEERNTETYQGAASMRARAAKNGNTCSEISHLVGRADCEHF